MWSKIRGVYKDNLFSYNPPFSLFSVPSSVLLIGRNPSKQLLTPFSQKNPLILIQWIAGIHSCCCMSLLPAEYTVLFPSNSSVLLAALAGNRDWWTYCQLWALQIDYTEGQLVHKPSYCPLISVTFTEPSHIQVGSEHYLEWWTTDQEEIIFMFHLVINPSYRFFALHTFIQSNSHRVYPMIFSVWYNCPHYTPTQLSGPLTP